MTEMKPAPVLTPPGCVWETNPLIERIYEGEDEVISHQKQGNKHRLVDCTRVPHRVGEWANRDDSAELSGGYQTAWDGPVFCITL